MPATAPTPTALKPSDINVLEDFNPRTEMDKKKLDELAASIKQEGIIQPLVVAEADEKGKHQLIAGHRRFAAAKLIKLRELPVVVRSVNGNAKALAVIENLQREDLNPVDEANGFAQVMEAEGINQAQLAKRLGISTSQVSDRLKLLKLLPEVQALFADRTLPASAASIIEKAQRFNERFAGCLALVLADDGVDASRTDDYDVAREVLEKAAALAVNGPKGEDGNQCEAAVLMSASGFIGQNDVRIADWPKTASKLREEIRGWRWHATWTESDIAAVRSYGCLFEHKVKASGETITLAYAFDAAFVIDLLQRKLDAWRKDEEKRRQQSRAERPQTPEDEKAERERQEKAAKERAARFAAFNRERAKQVFEKTEDWTPGPEFVKALCAVVLDVSGSALTQLGVLDPVNYPRVDLARESGSIQKLAKELAVETAQHLVECETADDALRLTARALMMAGAVSEHGTPVGSYWLELEGDAWWTDENAEDEPQLIFDPRDVLSTLLGQFRISNEAPTEGADA